MRKPRLVAVAVRFPALAMVVVIVARPPESVRAFRPAKLTASRIRTEEMLLGALLRRAERGRWPPPTTLDLQPQELRSEHAAATFYEVTRLWRDFDPDPVPRHEIIGALVDKHAAKRSEADAYLRRIRADVPSQEYIREYVRRIKADDVRHRGRPDCARRRGTRPPPRTARPVAQPRPVARG